MSRFLVLAVVAVFAALPAAAIAGGPVDSIKALYAADAPSIKDTGVGVLGDPKACKRFLSRALNAALDKDADLANKRGEPPTIDGDPFTDSQESGTKDIRISQLSATASKAQVLANFDKGDGERESLTYFMVLEDGAWRIDDIAYKRADGSSDTIRKQLGMK
jgi:hypothetical protein